MDPRPPPSSVQQGPDRRDPNAELKVNLLIAYFQSGRDEIITRVGHRESALLLFLGPSAAIFGLTFGDIIRPMILFAIAPLGLGASLVLTQHNDVIGALGHYCGTKLPSRRKPYLASSVQTHGRLLPRCSGSDPERFTVRNQGSSEPFQRSLVIVSTPACSSSQGREWAVGS